MQLLADKKALISGGSSGIGQAIALAYARQGAEVVFSYHKNPAGAEQTLQQINAIGGRGLAVSADMSQPEEVAQLFKAAIKHLGSLNILVNNAGIVTRFKQFTEITLAALSEIQQVNLQAPFLLMQAAAQQMQKQGQGGCILNISSLSAAVITPGLTHYECSKAALNALTRGAASDLARYRIRVNAIAPGLVATNINKAQREQDPEAWQNRSSKIPLGRVGSPDDIANMAVFLATPAAEWMTGAIIDIDGGIGVISPFAKPAD